MILFLARIFLLTSSALAVDFTVTIENDFTIPCPIAQLPCSESECEKIQIIVKINENKIFEKEKAVRDGQILSDYEINPKKEKFEWNWQAGGLTLKNTSVKDSGKYTCHIKVRKNIITDDSTDFSTYTTLTVQKKPLLIKAELHQSYIEASEDSGLKTIASCIYDPGKPEAIVRWVNGLNGAALQQNFFKTSITRLENQYTQELQMIPDKKFNNAYIKCYLSHPLLTDESESMKLNVTYKPAKPNIVQSGDRLFCAAEGNPMPTISWEVESEDDDVVTTIAETNVKIRFLGAQNLNYTCKAANFMGSSESTISNLSIATVAEIREKYTVFAGVIIGAVSLIFIIGIVVCHFAWKSTKEKDENESGWSEPLQITMTGGHSHSGAGDTGDFIYRVPVPQENNSKLMDYYTATDSGTDSHSIEPDDFESSFVRSESILQGQQRENARSHHSQPRFKYHEGYHSEHDLLNSSTEQPSQVV